MVIYSKETIMIVKKCSEKHLHNTIMTCNGEYSIDEGTITITFISGMQESYNDGEAKIVSWYDFEVLIEMLKKRKI